MSVSTTTPAAFEDHLRVAVQSLRVAFMELLTSVGADPTTPQDIARQFGLDKSLTWKISKVVQTEDPEVAASHLPGIAGLRIFIAAMKEAGGSASTLDDAESAIIEFERMVEIHTTDRATLDMLLSASRATRDPKRGESHRKQAYNGNSVIWGVQAEVRMASYFLALNDERPDMLDFGVVGGLVNYRRLRAGASWPLVRTEAYDEAGKAKVEDNIEYLDPGGVIHTNAKDGYSKFPMIREFTSDPPPNITVTNTPLGAQYEIGPGPVGNAGSSSCLFGKIDRAAHPVHATENSPTGENATWFFTPSEWALVDVFVHRDVPLPMPCELGLFGTIAEGEMRFSKQTSS